MTKSELENRIAELRSLLGQTPPPVILDGLAVHTTPLVQ
jgi:hypothetical protein